MNERVRLVTPRRNRFHQRWEVVIEHIRSAVGWILLTISAYIAWTQIAGWVEGWAVFAWRLFKLSLPGTFGTVRRHQNPFPRQRIVAPVRGLIELQFSFCVGVRSGH